MLRSISWVPAAGRGTCWLGGAALVVAAAAPSWAQRAQTLNGAPVQMQPYVSEPGAPTVTVSVGTPNPFAGLDGDTGGTGAGATGSGDGSGDGSAGSTGSGGSGSGGSNSGGSDALNTMLGRSWGSQASANAQSVGVNASALAATCVLESGCGVNTGNGSGAQGVFQMYSAAYNEGLRTALAANPSLSSQVVSGSAGMNDPVTESIASSGYLMQANQALQNAGISNPTVLDARGYYNFGPTNGIQLAQASSNQTMAQAMPNVSAATLGANGIASGETVGQWRASVSSKVGNAATQTVLN